MAQISSTGVWVGMDAKRLKLMYKFCPHCNKQCGIKRYKLLYFNAETKVWIVETSSSEDPSRSYVSREPEEVDTESSISLESDRESIVDEAIATDESPGSIAVSLEPLVFIPSNKEEEPRKHEEGKMPLSNSSPTRSNSVFFNVC